MTTAAHATTVNARISTRALLGSAAAAAPLWAVLSLTQAATREGFSLLRHPLSILSNGPLGWIQISTFLLTGVLTVIGSIGLRRVLRGTPGGVWAPRLTLLSGIGLIAAGAFVMDPADGFPTGTPLGTPTELTWPSYAHMAAGTLTFTSLIAANYVLGRHFSRTAERGRAIGSRVAATALLLGNGWAMSGGAAGTLTLAIGAITSMMWISAVAARYRSREA